jgi:hypothetical protein
VLQRRFKALPATVKSGLARASDARLTKWLEGAVDARSMEQVFD